VSEKKSLSGVFFDQSQHFDFYEGKGLLEQFFTQMRITVRWQKVKNKLYPWLVEYQTAELFHDSMSIGYAGMVEQALVDKLCDSSGALFIFELNGDYLQQHKPSTVTFVPLQKYPSVKRDVSLLVPASATVDELKKVIALVDKKISNIELIDFFTKPEWHNQKAVTFHVEMQDTTMTLTHDAIESMWERIIIQLQNYGAIIR